MNRASDKGHILIVDDDDDLLIILSDILAHRGYRVQTAGNLTRARRAIAKEAPSLLILDRNLPDGDGVDFCRELRDDAQYASLPILFLSVKSEVGEIVRGLYAGADDYLAKPFDMEEFLVRVVAILRRASRPVMSKT